MNTDTRQKKKKDFKLLPGFLFFFYEKDVVSSGYFSYVATWNVLTLIYIDQTSFVYREGEN